MKKMIAVLLSALLLAGMLPAVSFATEIVASGRCGENVTWTLDDEGTLTISGTGAMNDYFDVSPPWDSDIITSIVIEEGVTSIGGSTFIQLSTLKNVTIGNDVMSIGDYAFSSCYAITSLSIGSGVTHIGSCAFSECFSLTNLTIPNSVTIIGNSAFSNCTSLESVTIGNNVMNIGDFAFSDCYALTNVSIGNSVTHIGFYAFHDCYSLTSVIIPDSVTCISGYAFCGCTSLESVTIPNSVTNMEEGAFSGCSSLRSVTIPESLTSIVDYAFSGCRSLASVTIPESVTEIGSSAFSGCSSLANVTIPESVTEIGSSAFSGCSSLTSVTIPESVAVINGYTFSGCTSLTGVTLPKSITHILNGVFDECSALTDVYYGGTETDWSNVYIGTDNVFLHDANIHFHTHVYEVTETTDYTCTTDGSATYTCACGDSYTEVLPAAHRYEGTTVPPTCTMMGYTDYVCSRCGNSYTEYANATGHLDKNGDSVCDICGASLTGEPPVAHEHTPGDPEEFVIAAPTCTASGIKKTVVKCTVCGNTISEQTETLPALEHSYTATVTAPTCITQGYTTYRCARGDSEYIADYTNALGHTDANGDGVCDTCGAALNTGSGTADGSVTANNAFEFLLQFFKMLMNFFRGIFK